MTGKEKPDFNCFDLPDFLAETTALDQAGKQLPPLVPGSYKITEQAFSYMVLGRYPSQSSIQLISREWINRARARWDSYVAEHGEVAPEGTRAIAGLDVGEYGSDSNALCFRYGGYVDRLITWGEVDTIMTGDRSVEECKSRSLLRCCVDATGIGAGVSPHMRRNGCNAVAVKVASKPTKSVELGEFALLRDEGWWNVREWLRTDPGAMLPPDEDLIEELLCPTYEISNGKIQVMKKAAMRDLLKRSPDRADALCLTFFEPELLFNL